MIEYTSKEEALKIVGFEEKWLSDTKSTNYDVDIAFHGLKKKIESAPPADVRPNIHAHWKETKEGYYLCSNCDCSEAWRTPFCPGCGAVMDEKDELLPSEEGESEVAE